MTDRQAKVNALYARLTRLDRARTKIKLLLSEKSVFKLRYVLSFLNSKIDEVTVKMYKTYTGVED